MTAISEWAADAPPPVLGALDARWDLWCRSRMPPSAATFRRLLARVDAEAAAAAFGGWLRQQAAAGLIDAGALVIALDGKPCAAPAPYCRIPAASLMAATRREARKSTAARLGPLA